MKNVVSEFIAKARKPFTKGPFMKVCMLQKFNIQCKKKRACSTISLDRKTHWQSGLTSYQVTFINSYGTWRFTAYSVEFYESTDWTKNAQLAIFIRGINDKFQVTEELLRLWAKTKFREAQVKTTWQCQRELPYPSCLFGNTYLCEKVFLDYSINFNKCEYRSRLTDAHLEAVLQLCFNCELHQGKCSSAVWAEVLPSYWQEIKYKSIQGFNLLVQCKI